MTQTELELRAEIYELKRQLREITKEAAEHQERATEYELAITRIYREALKYAR
jgi:uncharacterized coiled-coil DUF342 family protein